MDDCIRVSDGVYTGTMYQNRTLEAIQMNLQAANDFYSIAYRISVKGDG